MYIPGDKEKVLVQTPYGRGLVVRTRVNANDGRPTMREIELLDWIKPETQKGLTRPSILYSPAKFPSVTPVVGSEVTTLFGRGKVLEIRNEDKMAIVRISSWRLAGRSTVTCYLSLKSIQVISSRKIFEMNVFDKVEHAQQLKKQAAARFSSKQYSEALQLYAEAVDAVRYVQHQKDSTNEVRADLLLVMITCCNNAATCCLHLREWDRAQKFGKNALVLIEALYEKKNDSKILQLLTREGTSNSKIFGSWKVKSYLVIARGLAERHEATEAMGILKRALEAISEFKQEGDSMYRHLASQEKEVRKLLLSCKDIKKADRKKEKQRAKAMFTGGGSLSEEKKDPDGKTEACSIATNVARGSDDVMQSIGTPSLTKVLQHAANAAPDQAPDVPPSPRKLSAKKRVSFADGTTPGRVDDDEPSFWDEHKEALVLLGGIALGSLCVHLLVGRRPK